MLAIEHLIRKIVAHTGKSVFEIGVAPRDAEVLEAMGMAIYMGAGPAVMYAAQAVEAFDQFTAARPAQAA